jgi:hypothetical protein
MRKIIFVIAIVVISQFVKSQDTIFLKDGNKISCKITNIDSSDVYFDMKRDNKKIQTFINKNVVLGIKYNTPPKEGKLANKKYYNSITFFAGLSQATGDFASDDVNSDKAGLAGNGLSLNFVFSHRFSEEFGFAIKGFFCSNEFKAEKLTEMIKSLINLPVTNNSVNYVSLGLLVGPTILVPVDKLSICGHLLLGRGTLTEPETTFTIISGSNTGWVKMGAVSAGSFMYNLGGGFTYSLNDNWNLLANIDFISGTFKFGTYTMSNSSGVSQDFERGNQNFSVVNITAGLCLKFY